MTKTSKPSAKKQNVPNISLIIPVYNADRYLEKCLDSILSQSLKNIEIICIDDNSTDNSLKILKKYEKAGIKIITLNRQQGQAHARNIGIKEASGEYIGFVDADDFVDKTMFEKLYKKAKKENADIEMCEAAIYDDDEKKTVYDDYFTLKCFSETFDNKVFNAEDTVDFIENINVTIWNKIYKTSFLKENKIKFSEGYIYEDMPFIYEVYTKAERIGILRESLYYYRVNTKNSTMTQHDKKVLDRVDMVEKTLAIFKELPYYEKIRGKILNWAIHDIYYRYTLIDGKYQKEYFFMMQKLFKNIDTTGVEDSLILDPYYPYFCEIPKRNYDESVKYFANKETFYDKYLESVKNIESDYEVRLQQKSEEIYKAIKEEYDNLLDKTPLNEYTKNFEQEKQEICNNYEKVITELKDNYETQQTKFADEKQEICDNYEKVITELKDNYETQQTKFADEKQEICDNYEKVITELKDNYETQQTKFADEKQEICDNYDRIINEIKEYTDSLHTKFDSEKKEICDNYDRIIAKIKENFRNEIEEQQKNYVYMLKTQLEIKGKICENINSFNIFKE